MPGLPAAIFVIDTKKEKIRDRRGQPARPPDRRRGGHELRPHRRELSDPRQRRRPALDPVFARMVADTVIEARSTALEGADQETVSFGRRRGRGRRGDAPRERLTSKLSRFVDHRRAARA